MKTLMTLARNGCSPCIDQVTPVDSQLNLSYANPARHPVAVSRRDRDDGNRGKSEIDQMGGDFRFDVTDFAKPGARNVLLLRVDATLSDGWFYEGAGIYRHVWLV